jgi:hypothetical protein
MILGPPNAGAILHGVEAYRDPHALEFVGAVLAGVGRGRPAPSFGTIGEDLFSDGSPSLKVTGMLKMIAMESL